MTDAGFHRTTSGKIQRGAFKKAFEAGQFGAAAHMDGAFDPDVDEQSHVRLAQLVAVMVGSLGALVLELQGLTWTGTELGCLVYYFSSSWLVRC